MSSLRYIASAHAIRVSRGCYLSELSHTHTIARGVSERHAKSFRALNSTNIG